MTTLLSKTLETSLSQEIRFSLSTRIHIAALIPYLFMFNAPAGTFTFELYSQDRTETVFTKTFDCDDIKTALSTTDNYAHVFFPIIPTNPVQIEAGLYTISITASGYTATVGSFLGWIQQHENIQNEMEYVPVNDEENPLAVRYKIYKEGVE